MSKGKRRCEPGADAEPGPVAGPSPARAAPGSTPPAKKQKTDVGSIPDPAAVTELNRRAATDPGLRELIDTVAKGGCDLDTVRRLKVVTDDIAASLSRRSASGLDDTWRHDVASLTFSLPSVDDTAGAAAKDRTTPHALGKVSWFSATATKLLPATRTLHGGAETWARLQARAGPKGGEVWTYRKLRVYPNAAQKRRLRECMHGQRAIHNMVVRYVNEQGGLVEMMHKERRAAAAADVQDGSHEPKKILPLGILTQRFAKEESLRELAPWAIRVPADIRNHAVVQALQRFERVLDDPTKTLSPSKRRPGRGSMHLSKDGWHTGEHTLYPEKFNFGELKGMREIGPLLHESKLVEEDGKFYAVYCLEGDERVLGPQPAAAKAARKRKRKASELPEGQGYACPDPACKRRFVSREGLKQHLQHVHGDTDTLPSGKAELPCKKPGCERTFPTAFALARHEKSGQCCRVERTETGVRYKCPRCNESFAAPNVLSRHLALQTCKTGKDEDKPYKCDAPGCSKAYKHRSGLWTHRRDKHANRPAEPERHESNAAGKQAASGSTAVKPTSSRTAAAKATVFGSTAARPTPSRTAAGKQAASGSMPVQPTSSRTAGAKQVAPSSTASRPTSSRTAAAKASASASSAGKQTSPRTATAKATSSRAAVPKQAASGSAPVPPTSARHPVDSPRHPEAGANKYVCPTPGCGQAFKWSQLLRGHLLYGNCQGRAERALATATLAAPAPKSQSAGLARPSATPAAQSSSFLASPAVCSIDPGVRTFATVFDVDGEQLLEVGANDQARLYRLLLHIDHLNKRAKEGNAKLRRRLRVAVRRQWRRIRNLVTDVHGKLAAMLVRNYDVIILPRFDTKRMCRRKGRKLRKKTVRLMYAWAHGRFRKHLEQLCSRPDTRASLVLCTEEYTSKVCSRCGNKHEKLGGSKVYGCKECLLRADRDANGAKNILQKTLVEVLRQPGEQVPADPSSAACQASVLRGRH